MRKMVLDQCIDRNVTLLPTHFMTPFNGRLKLAGDDYQWTVLDA